MSSIPNKCLFPLNLIRILYFSSLLFSLSLVHQLFSFKEHVSSEQKQALLEICKIHTHPGITPDIRRELEHSKCRDEEMSEPPPQVASAMAFD